MRKIKEELKKIMPANLVAGIIRMRKNKLKLISGFDSQYGKIEIFSKEDQEIAKNNR